MAYRFPLVLDTTADLVRELPNGDHLNLNGTPIFDGNSIGTVGYTLRSRIYGANQNSPEGSAGVLWTRQADVFTSDEQTLTNKTFESSEIDMGSCVLSNISNSILVNSNFNFRLTSGGTVSTKTTTNTSVNLGGSINITDLNTDTTYSLTASITNITSGADNGASKANFDLTAGGSGSGTDTVSVKVGPSYLKFTEPTANTFLLTWSMQTLTAGNYIQKNADTTARTYNGLNAQTFTVDASSTNTGNKVVLRTASGNFNAGTIYANLNGSATRVSNTITFEGDLIAYNPTNTASSYSSYDGSIDEEINFDATPGSTTVYGSNKIVARNSNGDIWGNVGTFDNITCTGTVTVSDDIFIKNPNYGQPDEPQYLSGFMKADGSIDNKSYIPLLTTKNAYGTRYVQTTEPSSPQNGDIWYEIL